MGQRLNLEILKDGDVLANAYYHWSGYSTSSANLASFIIEEIKKDTQGNMNDVLYAISLLQKTGAGINNKEIQYYYESNNIIKDELYSECLTQEEIVFNTLQDRNDGLIGISPKVIEETRKWEEARVSIDIGIREVTYEALYEVSVEDYIKDETKDGIPPDLSSEISVDNFSNKFEIDQFEAFCLFIKNLLKQKKYQFRSNDTMYLLIE